MVRTQTSDVAEDVKRKLAGLVPAIMKANPADKVAVREQAAQIATLMWTLGCIENIPDTTAAIVALVGILNSPRHSKKPGAGPGQG